MDYLDRSDYLTVAELKIYDNFRYGDTQNDIALLKLNSPVDRSRVLALCDKSYAEEPLAICGIGTEFLNLPSRYPVYPPTVRKTVLKQRSGTDCPADFADYVDTDKLVCATSNDLSKGPCFADSGSPLYPLVDGSPFCVYGVISQGRCQWQSIFPKVSAYKDWIQKNMN